jgi:hypothetical protein
LGDDIYSDYNTCKAVLDKGYSFIFTCKEESHPWLTEMVKNSYPEEYKRREWNGREHLEYRYRWINGVQIRDSRQTLEVNHVYFEIWNEEKKKVTYKNAWVTDKEVGEGNVRLVVESGRGRWKIENEHNNVLKNGGYNLEHNFGHGKEHACEIYVVLNLLGFLMHGLMLLMEEEYQKTWASFGRRETFFEGLRFSFRRFLHESWEEFLIFVLGDEPDG